MLTWLLTSTTYGAWLPGDGRGFVGRVTDRRAEEALIGGRVEHDAPGSEYDRDVPALQTSARQLMKGEPIWLTEDQAAAVRDQFVETARHRGWNLLAVAVMANHFHLVVAAPEGVLTDALLRDFKSYASRALNARWPRPQSGTWWTTSASRRRLPDDNAVARAVQYVLNQHRPLAVYPPPASESESKTERGTSVPRA